MPCAKCPVPAADAVDLAVMDNGYFTSCHGIDLKSPGLFRSPINHFFIIAEAIWRLFQARRSATHRDSSIPLLSILRTNPGRRPHHPHCSSKLHLRPHRSDGNIHKRHDCRLQVIQKPRIFAEFLHFMASRPNSAQNPATSGGSARNDTSGWSNRPQHTPAYCSKRCLIPAASDL